MGRTAFFGCLARIPLLFCVKKGGGGISRKKILPPLPLLTFLPSVLFPPPTPKLPHPPPPPPPPLPPLPPKNTRTHLRPFTFPIKRLPSCMHLETAAAAAAIPPTIITLLKNPQSEKKILKFWKIKAFFCQSKVVCWVFRKKALNSSPFAPHASIVSSFLLLLLLLFFWEKEASLETTFFSRVSRV